MVAKVHWLGYPLVYLQQVSFHASKGCVATRAGRPLSTPDAVRSHNVQPKRVPPQHPEAA